MEHFGAAITAQQLPPIEAHGAEVLVLYGYWGPLLGSRGPRNESLFLRRCALRLWGLLPSQRSDSDLSSPQTWGLDGIRQVVLADLGEEGSRQSEHSTNKLWRVGEDGLTRPPGQPSPGNAGTAPSQPGVSPARLQPHADQTRDRASARAGILTEAEREEGLPGWAKFKDKTEQSGTLMDMLEDSVPHSMISRKLPSCSFFWGFNLNTGISPEEAAQILSRSSRT